ncbi:MAG: hypothetical protein AAFZ65_14565, partial [Planctomycetota bacterium]
GRTRLEQATDGLQPELSNRIELEGVTLRLLSGSSLVPLVLTCDSLEGDLVGGRFETPDRAQIDGSGIVASGDGLVMDLERGLARFEANGECRVIGTGAIDGDGTGGGRVASSGPLEIRRTGTREAPTIELVARQRALLAVEGANGLLLDAREITILGRPVEPEPSDGAQSEPGSETETVAEEPSPTFLFESLKGVGDMSLMVQGNEFTAQQTQFRFTPEGALQDARMEGGPAAWLRIAPPGEDPRDADDEPEQVKIWGDTSMTLDWEPTVGFQVAGPARLSWRETSLWAAGGLSGRPPLDGNPAKFHAWSDVRIDFEGWEIRTPELDGRIEVTEAALEGEDDAYALTLEARSETLIEGQTEDGEQVRLRALDGLVFKGDEENWTVPRADGVTLTLASDPPLIATALHLEDFDPRTKSFAADGQVDLQVADATLRGARIEAEGRDDITVLGNDEQRVTYDADTVHVEALELARQGTRVTAKREVAADVRLEGLTADIQADQLELFGAALEQDPALRRSGPTTLIATGNVTAGIEEGLNRYDLDGQYLWLERTPTPEGVGAVTNFRMTGNVHAVASAELGAFELEAEELEGLLFDSATTDSDPDQVVGDADGELVATGNVWLKTKDERRMEARAERLTMLPGGRAILEPAEAGMVQVEGLLPRQQRPFQLTAKRVDATETRIEAERPTITLLKPLNEVDPTPLDGLRATAVRMVAEPARIDLERDVSILGRTPEGDSWALRSQTASFRGAEAGGMRLALSRIIAEGNVEVDYAAGPSASGDLLEATAWSGRVRLEGNLARVFMKDYTVVSDWIEFDTRDFLIASGRTDLEMPAVEAPAGGGNQP